MPCPPPPKKMKCLTTLTAATVVALLLATTMDVRAQTRECTINEATMESSFPVTGILEEVSPNNEAIISVHFPTDCAARTERLLVCLDLWETTACAPEDSCDGRIRGSQGFLGGGGWTRTSGPTVCNTNFLTPGGGLPIQHRLNFLYNIANDSVKADRQNYLIVHMHNPYQVLRIPIRDND